MARISATVTGEHMNQLVNYGHAAAYEEVGDTELDFGTDPLRAMIRSGPHSGVAGSGSSVMSSSATGSRRPVVMKATWAVTSVCSLAVVALIYAFLRIVVPDWIFLVGVAVAYVGAVLIYRWRSRSRGPIWVRGLLLLPYSVLVAAVAMFIVVMDIFVTTW